MNACLVLVAVVAACTAQAPQGWRPSGRVLLLPARIQEEPSTPTPQANNTQSDEKESDRILDSGEYYVILEDGKLQMVKYTTAALKEEQEKPATQPQNQQSQYKQSQFQQSQNQQYPVYQQPQQFQQQKQPQQFQNQQYPVYQQPQQFQQQKQGQQFQNQQYPVYQQPQQFQQQKQGQQFQQSQNQQYPVYQQPQQYQPSQKPQKYQQPQQSEQYRSPSAAGSNSYPQQANPESFAELQLEYVQFPLPGSQFAQTKLEYTAPQAEAAPETEDKDDKESAGYEARVQYRDVKPISAPIYAYNPAPLVRILKK